MIVYPFATQSYSVMAKTLKGMPLGVDPEG